jgi:hypothetical protein
MNEVIKPATVKNHINKLYKLIEDDARENFYFYAEEIKFSDEIEKSLKIYLEAKTLWKNSQKNNISLEELLEIQEKIEKLFEENTVISYKKIK